MEKSDLGEVSFDEHILLITQTINWLAVRDEKCHEQLKRINTGNIDDLILRREEQRIEILMKLIQIMEDYGNFVNSMDSTDSVDTAVTEVAYKIIHDSISF